MRKQCVLFSVLFASSSAFAATETVGDVTWEYEINNGEARIYKYVYVLSGGGVAVSFPSGTTEITVPQTLGGAPVTEIGRNAFDAKTYSGYGSTRCAALTTITIPEGVTKIWAGAFSGCSGLTSLVLPQSVTNIGYGYSASSTSVVNQNVFQGCSGLTTLTIPSGVTEIKSNAFSGCSGLKTLYLPSRFTGSRFSAPSSCTVIYYDSVSLEIFSEHGDPVPETGSFQFMSGETVACSVSSPVPGEPGVRFVCTGWSGTGSVPADGVGTNFAFEMEEDSTLTWNWKTQALVSVSVSGGFCETATQWLETGENASIPVVPDFSGSRLTLAGDTNGVVFADNLLSVPVSGPRNVYMTFVPETVSKETVDGIEWSYVVSETRGIAILCGDAAMPSFSPTNQGTIRIPSTLGGLPVKGIGPGAFQGCTLLAGILFPGDAPETVAADAFDDVDGNCTIHVRAAASGWGNEFPGTWHGLTIMNDLCRLSTGVVGSGTVSGGGDYVSGDIASLFAVANDGFLFCYWTGDFAAVASNATVTVLSDTTATAVFVPETAADNLVHERAEENGYYTREQIHALAVGDLLFDVVSGKARIGVKLMQSSNLADSNGWSAVDLSVSDLDVGDDGSVGMLVPAEGKVRFFRLETP